MLLEGPFVLLPAVYWCIPVSAVAPAAFPDHHHLDLRVGEGHSIDSPPGAAAEAEAELAEPAAAAAAPPC